MNFKSFWILSIYTIWDGLSLKTISRYCPFKADDYVHIVDDRSDDYILTLTICELPGSRQLFSLSYSFLCYGFEGGDK